MNEHDSRNPAAVLTRRELLRRSALGATALSTPLVFPGWLSAGETILDAQPGKTSNLYSELLKTWCDGLVAHQITAVRDPALLGGIICPACALIHGRCGDAVYPLLHVAHGTGDEKYLRAALLVHDWSERTVSRPDGSWVNDVTLSSWKGTTVFHAIALAEALHYHGALLDAQTRRLWTERLARAATFLDGFLTIAAGNINYPVTGAFCFAICGQVLDNRHYLDRARELAHASLDYFTPNGLLFGEGHPQTSVTRKKCRPVDLGYNVEESLPALALYALATNDAPVLDQVIVALRAHMEFMLPDGAWDNSWGSRNYKWSWWGSRTSDGCQPGYALLAPHEPKFREVAWRNLELMKACTHDGLLYGGLHYFAHGDLPCVHHTFTHAKALATVLDRDAAEPPQPRLALPRDEAYGVKTYPEIGTHLVSIGDWRATVTEYDFEYGTPEQTGGHASGGALSLLFHKKLGPILAASMTRYQRIEIANQQEHGDYPHMPLTPRIEGIVGDQTYTSLSDFDALLTLATINGAQLVCDARGRLLTAAHEPVASGYAQYHLIYRVMAGALDIVASADAAGLAGRSQWKLIVPVVSPHTESADLVDTQTLVVAKPGGRLVIKTSAPGGFEGLTKQRTFNLVPGFECLPIAVALVSGEETRITLGAD